MRLNSAHAEGKLLGHLPVGQPPRYQAQYLNFTGGKIGWVGVHGDGHSQQFG